MPDNKLYAEGNLRVPLININYRWNDEGKFFHKNCNFQLHLYIGRHLTSNHIFFLTDYQPK